MKKILAIITLTLLFPAMVYALPVYKEVRQNYVKSDSVLLDRNGAVLQEMRIDKNRRRLDWTGLSDISPALVQAVIHAEDKSFYTHNGVDFMAISASLLKSMLDKM